MIRVLNIIIIIFSNIFFKVFSFYSSLNNKDLISKNRENIDNIIDTKVKIFHFLKMILIMLLNLILATIKMMMEIKKDFGIYLK